MLIIGYIKKKFGAFTDKYLFFFCFSLVFIYVLHTTFELLFVCVCVCHYFNYCNLYCFVVFMPKLFHHFSCFFWWIESMMMRTVIQTDCFFIHSFFLFAWYSIVSDHFFPFSLSLTVFNVAWHRWHIVFETE